MALRLTVRRGERAWEASFPGPIPIREALSGMGVPMEHPCGGNGTCGKCAAIILGEVSPPGEAEIRAGTRLTCQAVALGDCDITLPPQATWRSGVQRNSLNIRPSVCNMEPRRYGAAIDVGTTTLAVRVFDMRDGACVGEALASNPQAEVAADVMGRIGAAEGGGAARLKDLVIRALEEMLRGARGAAGIADADVRTLVIAGNTAMLTLLTGRDAAPLCRAPFQAAGLFDLWENVLGRDAYLPPCMDAFVGADLTCAVLASGMCLREEVALLLDAGTNAEIALWKDGALYVASAAAGPALEGAGIEMGSGCVEGAIDRVDKGAHGEPVAHTIGDAPPASICGSGLVDALAYLLKAGRVDEGGAMREERATIAGPVYLSRRDVRQAQLAKAAIAAGIRTLLGKSGTRAQDVRTLYLAGGFGSGMNPVSAACIGLIPRELSGRTVALGNAALTGAAMLLDVGNVAGARRIAGLSRHVRLSGDAGFAETFVEEMGFGEG